MKNHLYFFSFIFFLVLLVIIAYSWKNYTNYQTTDNAYIRSSITNISSRIDGYVSEVPGIINTEVKKGQVLVKFDKAPFLSKVTTSRAELKAAEAKIIEIDALKLSEKLKIEEQKLNISLAKSKIDSEKSKRDSEFSNLKMLEKDKNRLKKLLKSNNVTKSDYDKILANYNSSLYKVKQYDADIEYAQTSYKVIKKEIEKLNINLKKLTAEELRYIAKKDSLKSQLESSLIDLDSTIIKSPISGIIANRIVEPGVFMKNGWPLMSIVPVDDTWVIANFKETQLKKIQVGQEAEILIDAYPKTKIIGEVLSLSPASASSFSLIPPQNASGNFVKVVQRVPIKITFDTPEKLRGKIVPGLSVYVKIITK